MCDQCDYRQLLEDAGIEPSPNRLRILQAIGAGTGPLSVDEIYKTLKRNRRINRVTVYRVLELLESGGLVERLSAGGRAARFGLAPNQNHGPHSHFYCTSCGRLDCLSPESVIVETHGLERAVPGRIDRLEVRVDGICRACLGRSG